MRRDLQGVVLTIWIWTICRFVTFSIFKRFFVEPHAYLQEVALSLWAQSVGGSDWLLTKQFILVMKKGEEGKIDIKGEVNEKLACTRGSSS